MLTIKTCRMDFAEEDCAARLGRLGLAALVLFGPFDNIEIVASRKMLAQSTRIVLRRIRLSPKIRWNSICSPPPNTSTVRLRQCFTVAREEKNDTEVSELADTRQTPGTPAPQGCAKAQVPRPDGKRDRYKRN